MKIEIEFENCTDCPFCKAERCFGTDGRDNYTVYICSKGAYGEYDLNFGWFGKTSIPKIPPVKCPYFKVEVIKRVANDLDIRVKTLENVLKQNKCKIESID